MNIIAIISIILAGIILIVIIIALVRINKKLKQKIVYERERLLFYEKKLEKLRKPNLNRKDLEELNSLARKFFKERFKFDYSLTYLELAKKFRKEGKDKQAKFCSTMTELIYSGKNMDSEDIREAVTEFANIL